MKKIIVLMSLLGLIIRLDASSQSSEGFKFNKNPKCDQNGNVQRESFISQFKNYQDERENYLNDTALHELANRKPFAVSEESAFTQKSTSTETNGSK
ncbi:MAG: hypothetical protein JO129_02240 [Candidatus Dependentiae bacterium]|nr:hypothetical protein [Candidatus Dependentiae bacterium]